MVQVATRQKVLIRKRALTCRMALTTGNWKCLKFEKRKSACSSCCNAATLLPLLALSPGHCALQASAASKRSTDGSAGVAGSKYVVFVTHHVKSTASESDCVAVHSAA